MALFLASDESAWITGTSMLVDGGYMARAHAFGSRRPEDRSYPLTSWGRHSRFPDDNHALEQLMGRLDNKVAVITGAASGMGRATAIRFAGEGAAVVIADLNQDGGEAAVRECRENGGRAVFQKTDVSAEAQVKAAIDRATSEFGRLDITFNNAGLGGALGPLRECHGREVRDRTFAILLRSVFLGIKHSIPLMRKTGGGSIISTASIAGMSGQAGPLVYSVAKAGVIHLTKCAAVELGKERIRVNCICPGGINTPLLHKAIPGGEAVTRQFLTAGPADPAGGQR